MQILNGVAHLNTNEFAQRVGVSPATVRYWRVNDDPRKPRGIKLENVVLYRAADVDEFAQTYRRSRA